jgi:hypothetical protein
MDYMGIDHHKQYSHITLMDEKRKKLRAGKVANYRTELAFPGLQERFAPFVIHGGMDAFLPAQIRNALLTTKAFQNDSNLFLCGKFATSSPLDLSNDRFRRCLGLFLCCHAFLLA